MSARGVATRYPVPPSAARRRATDAAWTNGSTIGSIGMNNGLIDLRRMGRVLLLVAGLGVGGLGGCASQQSYDQLLDANRSLKERNEELLRQNQEISNENRLMQDQRTANESALAALGKLNDTLKKQLADAG